MQATKELRDLRNSWIRQKSKYSIGTYYNALLLLVTIGTISAVYLTVGHYRNYTDIGYQSFCAITKSLNCDTVAQSPYSLFLDLPLAVWGVMGYSFFLCGLIIYRPKLKSTSGFSLLILISLLFSVVSVYLASISSYYIRSYCIVCIFTYGINFLLLLVSWMGQKRFGQAPFLSDLSNSITILRNKWKESLIFTTFVITIFILVLITYPNYWQLKPIHSSDLVKHGITEEGHPWIGAESPDLTIVEFSDYLCFQCGKLHTHLRNLVNKYPERIRLVHRQFPLDHVINPIVEEPTHLNSGLVSLFSLKALDQDLFWPVNDLLFQMARGKKINFSQISESTGLDIKDIQEMMTDQRLLSKLAADIRDGIEQGVTATPAFLINEELYLGIIPTEIIGNLVKGN